MKKLLALILAVMMIATLSITAFADDTYTEPTGASDDLLYTPSVDDVSGTENTSNTSSSNVGIEFDSTDSITNTYYVVVEWAALRFQYSFGENVKWNPEMHQYQIWNEDQGNFTNEAIGEWKYWDDSKAEFTAGEEIQNAITVKNHSNGSVWVTAYFGDADNCTLNNVKATISGDQNKEIVTAEGTEFNNAPNCVYAVKVENAPTADSNFILGTITVTISTVAPATT